MRMLCDGERAVSDGQRARPADQGPSTVCWYNVLCKPSNNGFTETLSAVGFELKTHTLLTCLAARMGPLINADNPWLTAMYHLADQASDSPDTGEQFSILRTRTLLPLLTAIIPMESPPLLVASE